VSDQPDLPPAPLDSIFELDFGANGGVFAPKSLEALQQWIASEVAFWSWLPGEVHTQVFNEGRNQLTRAQQVTQHALQYGQVGTPQHEQSIEQIKSALAETYVSKKVPHSSTPLAKQIESVRANQGDIYASFFAATYCPPSQGHSIQPQTQHGLAGWRGMLDGLATQFPQGQLNDVSTGAARDAAEQLRAKAEALVSEKTKSLEEIQRGYTHTVEKIRAAATSQLEDFKNAQAMREEEFAKLRQEHSQKMAQISETFREKMTLEAPVEYWVQKGKRHGRWVFGTGLLVILLLVGSCVLLLWDGNTLLASLRPDQTPPPWRVGRLALLSVFTVWGVRLVVRVFLSHLHLATDAGERVVLVKTYLSLMQADKLPADQDRQLILQALFRHASGGIVKDEGLPPTFLDYLTRTSK
jgi:Family of unknown function (DUF6161)